MPNKILGALVALSLTAAAPTVETGSLSGSPIVLQLDGIPTGSLVTMLMRDVMRVPYVIAPDVLADRRPTSVSLRIPRNQVPEKVVGYLRRTGFTVTLSGGTVYVSKGARTVSGMPSAGSLAYQLQPDAPSGSPVDLGRPDFPRATERQPDAVFPVVGSARSGQSPDADFGGGAAASSPQVLVGYLPAYRDPAYLATVIGPLLPGIVFGARAEVKANTDAGNISPQSLNDVLVMGGSTDEISRARALVVLLDRPRPMVAVKAVVMQVSDVQARGSALNVLLKLGGGKVQAGSFPSVAASGAQFVRIATGAVQAMLSAVREDSRFRVVASPNLAALSGEVATMNAGAQVPTVGSVAVTDGGTPVQSVVYRDSGITLTVRPVVRGDLIEMDVRQERSTFTKTTTGVEDSPTLNKSAASASVVLKTGESVVLAGLTEDSSGNTREGLLGGLLGVRTREKSASELLVVLQAEIVPTPAGSAGSFVEISGSCVGTDIDASCQNRQLKGTDNAPVSPDPLAPVGKA